jgi:predicted protein tyrosine phosphatase
VKAENGTTVNMLPSGPAFLLVQGRDFTHKQKVLRTFDNTRKTPRLISYDIFNDKNYQYLLIPEKHTAKLAFLIF